MTEDTSYFVDQTLFLSPACYNMLKGSGLIEDGDEYDVFTGFSNMHGVQPIRVKALSAKKMPEGVQMLLKLTEETA